MHDPKISRTSNYVENYYRQTLPRANKKKYKTIQGLINYLKLKMQNGQQNTENITKQLDIPINQKDIKKKIKISLWKFFKVYMQSRYSNDFNSVCLQ